VPWHVTKGHSECTDSKPWAVVNEDSGAVEGCHATEDDANAQMRALYANEPEADVSDPEALGGDPNPGTEKDRRLKENKKGLPKPGGKKDKRLKGNKSALEQAMEFARSRTGPITQDDLDEALRQTSEDLGKVFPEQTPEEIEAAMTAATRTKTKVNAGWKGTICVEGITSGDQREFSEGALTWADPPIPLRWKKEDAHGGVNDKTVAVGTITKIERVGNEIQAEGVLDLGSEDGLEVHRRLDVGMHTGGISIDADDITDADVEFIWPEDHGDGDGDEGDLLEMLFASPEKILFHAGRIRAATLVDIPAFVEASIALTAAGEVQVPEGGNFDLSAAALDTIVRLETNAITLAAAGTEVLANPAAPPREWFQNPKLSVPMNVIVTDEGRVYGHAAHWDQCHIGHPEMCITPPYEESHPYFMTGELVCADGSRVQVGQITLGTGHAPLPYSAQRAAEHYDNTGTCVADVALGNDEHGIWLAGAVRPSVDEARVRELRAAGKVSGDWRRIAGSLRLVGLLGVNVAGFQTPQIRSRVASGKQLALVAAGMPKVGSGTVDIERAALRLLMDMQRRQIHGAEE
jgi:hypothetical protein